MTAPRIAAIILAAGASRRMQGRDKLTETALGKPLLRRAVDAAWASQASEITVVLGARAEARLEVLGGLPVNVVTNSQWQSGMAASIRKGIESLDPNVEGAIIMLADMPEIGAPLINQLLTLFDPERGIDIVRPRAASGPIGNPVLFGKRHFPALAALEGDTGARHVIAANPDCVVDLPTPDDAVLTDLDTPEAWTKWLSQHEG